MPNNIVEEFQNIEKRESADAIGTKLLGIINSHKVKMIDKAVSVLKSTNDVDDATELLFDNDAIYDIYKVANIDTDDYEEYFGGDYHDNQKLQDAEMDIWISAAQNLKMSDLVKELKRVKKEGL